jgi:hypothetical protein
MVHGGRCAAIATAWPQHASALDPLRSVAVDCERGLGVVAELQLSADAVQHVLSVRTHEHRTSAQSAQTPAATRVQARHGTSVRQGLRSQIHTTHSGTAPKSAFRFLRVDGGPQAGSVQRAGMQASHGTDRSYGEACIARIWARKDRRDALQRGDVRNEAWVVEHGAGKHQRRHTIVVVADQRAHRIGEVGEHRGRTVFRARRLQGLVQLTPPSVGKWIAAAGQPWALGAERGSEGIHQAQLRGPASSERPHGTVVIALEPQGLGAALQMGVEGREATLLPVPVQLAARREMHRERNPIPHRVQGHHLHRVQRLRPIRRIGQRTVHIHQDHTLGHEAPLLETTFKPLRGAVCVHRPKPRLSKHGLEEDARIHRRREGIPSDLSQAGVLPEKERGSEPSGDGNAIDVGGGQPGVRQHRIDGFPRKRPGPRSPVEGALLLRSHKPIVADQRCAPIQPIVHAQDVHAMAPLRARGPHTRVFTSPEPSHTSHVPHARQPFPPRPPFHVPTMTPSNTRLALAGTLLLIACAGRMPGPTRVVGKGIQRYPSSVHAAPRATTPVRPSRFGNQVAGAADFYLTHAPRGFRDDCSGFVCAAISRVGPEVQGNSRSLWELAKQTGALHRKKVPRPGDIAFFDNTYDRNRNGRWDDELTHVAVVLSVDDDGTILLAHAGTSRGRTTLHMNLKHPDVRRTDAGIIHNDYLRRRGDKDPAAGRYLSGELWKGFASFEPDLFR